MYLDKLDSRITAAFFDRKATERRRQPSGVLRSIEDHQQANQTYLEDGVALLELAGRAHDLFMQFDANRKRQLLGLLVASSTWKEGELSVKRCRCHLVRQLGEFRSVRTPRNRPFLTRRLPRQGPCRPKLRTGSP